MTRSPFARTALPPAAAPLFAGGLAAAALLAGCGRHRSEVSPAPTGLLVRTTNLAERAFVDGLQVEGTVRARTSVRVAARVAGPVDARFVEEGASVTNGQPLFQTDRETLENQLSAREADCRVAAAARVEAEAAVRAAAAALEKARTDAGRFQRLHADDAAVSLDAVERARLQESQADAATRQAQAGVDLALARAAQADTLLAIARRQLADATVRAPFDGVVTRRLLDAGDYASAGTAVLTMDERADDEVAFSLPAEAFGRVAPGRTVVLFADGTRQPVHYRAADVHPITRTFEVRARVPAALQAAPGMLVPARVVFEERRGPALPDTAIGRRNGVTVVFAAASGRAVQHTVRTGASWDGWTEVLDADRLAGLAIVAEAQALLNDGDALRTE